MTNSFISINSLRKGLKEASPGAFTPDSIKKTQEVTQDLVKSLARTSRLFADTAGRKRVTDEDIKMAAKFLLKS